MDREMTGRRARDDATGEARERRGGVALVAVLLLGTAIALLGHAGVVLGLALERSARGDASAAEVDAHLAARLESVMETLASLHDPLPAGVEGRLVSAELLRIRVDSAGRGRAGLIWAPDPQTRLHALGAGVRTAGSIALSTSDRITESATDSCGPTLAVPHDFAPVATLPWDGESPRTVGPLDSADWADLPPPPAGGAAGEAAWRAVGPLTLADGAWAGLLVVEGSLTIDDGAELSGWTAVTGDVHVHGGGRIEGVVRAGGDVVLDAGGTIEVAPCRAVLGLARLEPFALPVPILGRAWSSDPPG